MQARGKQSTETLHVDHPECKVGFPVNALDSGKLPHLVTMLVPPEVHQVTKYKLETKDSACFAVTYELISTEVTGHARLGMKQSGAC